MADDKLSPRPPGKATRNPAKSFEAQIPGRSVVIGPLERVQFDYDPTADAKSRVANLKVETDENLTQIAKDSITARITPADTRDERSQQIGQQNERNLPGAVTLAQLLDSWLAAKGVAESERASYAAKINRIVASVGRPQWAERRLRPDLAHLSAPRFLRAVYPDALDAQGRLIDEELVRLSDPTLVGVVQAYIAQLKKSPSRTLGDAAGLVFTRKDNRGRPEKPQRRRKRHSPGP
jgi:hypothetical protein